MPGESATGGNAAGKIVGANAPLFPLTFPYCPYQFSARTSNVPLGIPPNFSRSKSMSYSPRPVYLNVFPRASGGGGGVLIPPSMPKANCVDRPANVIPDFCRLDRTPPQSPVSVVRVQKSSSELPNSPAVPSPGEKPYPIASLTVLGVSICCNIGCAMT